MAGVPFKVFLPFKNIKVGVVAQSLKHLQQLLKEQFGLCETDIMLEDGTLLCNEDYFNLLAPQTNLVVQPACTGAGEFNTHAFMIQLTIRQLFM